MRLDRYIGNTTDHSRKEVKRLLKERMVRVDGELVRDPAHHLTPGQQVTLDGEPLAALAPRHFMLHKPKGYVCATKDGDHPVVLDLLDQPNKDRLQIAGRLDIDTTGLVLITDDGGWNHAVTSPRRECHKVYLVRTADAIAPDTGVKFAQGLMLDGETKRTKPAVLEVIGATEARITLGEGRYHQVKRMFAALGNRVLELHREAIGGIVLDPGLDAGEYRPLTTTEIASVDRPASAVTAR